jgi:hypothetical protein
VATVVVTAAAAGHDDSAASACSPWKKWKIEIMEQKKQKVEPNFVRDTHPIGRAPPLIHKEV